MAPAPSTMRASSLMVTLALLTGCVSIRTDHEEPELVYFADGVRLDVRVHVANVSRTGAAAYALQHPENISVMLDEVHPYLEGEAHVTAFLLLPNGGVVNFDFTPSLEGRRGGAHVSAAGTTLRLTPEEPQRREWYESGYHADAWTDVRSALLVVLWQDQPPGTLFDGYFREGTEVQLVGTTSKLIRASAADAKPLLGAGTADESVLVAGGFDIGGPGESTFGMVTRQWGSLRGRVVDEAGEREWALPDDYGTHGTLIVSGSGATRFLLDEQRGRPDGFLFVGWSIPAPTAEVPRATWHWEWGG